MPGADFGHCHQTRPEALAIDFQHELLQENSAQALAGSTRSALAAPVWG